MAFIHAFYSTIINENESIFVYNCLIETKNVLFCVKYRISYFFFQFYISTLMVFLIDISIGDLANLSESSFISIDLYKGF